MQRAAAGGESRPQAQLLSSFAPATLQPDGRSSVTMHCVQENLYAPTSPRPAPFSRVYPFFSILEPRIGEIGMHYWMAG